MNVLILKQTKYTTKIYSHDHVYNKILDRWKSILLLFLPLNNY